tara:strand:+ start:385 stop:558 length:174 start_codon:yes stop_codon:yes gene_type:complete
MDKENLVSMISRLHLCNNTKLENKDEYLRIKKTLNSMDDSQFFQKLWDLGFYDKEAS